MKAKYPIIALLLSFQTAVAQNGIQLSLSSGVANASSKGKDNLIGNGFHLQTDVFVPFYGKSWNPNGKEHCFAVGIFLGGNYTSVKNIPSNNSDVSTKYNAYNTPIAVESKMSRSNSNSYSGFAGIQAAFGFGRFHISPSINAGYLSFKQEGSVQTGTASINGEQQQKDLVKREPQIVQGLIFKPQLRAGYKLKHNMAVFAGFALVTGPEIQHTTQYLVPEGGFKENNTYEISQLAKGTWESSVQTSRYAITEINIGLSVALGKKKTKKGANAASASYAAGKSMAPEARPGNPIGGIIVKGGKNPGGNSINVVSDENGQITFDVATAGDYMLQLSAPDQTAGRSISEKGINRTEVAEMARPGTPIGGIVVKGGKKSGR